MPIKRTRPSKKNASPAAASPFARQAYEVVAIDSIVEHPQNPRRGDLHALDESIEANGFYGAVVVQRSRRRIIAGNHRHRKLKERGEQFVPVIFVDVDDERALRILLADNGASDRATNDKNELAILLEELVRSSGASSRDEVNAALRGTTFGHDALEAMLVELRGKERTPGAEPGGTREVSFSASDFAHKCPRCQFEFNDD